MNQQLEKLHLVNVYNEASALHDKLMHLTRTLDTEPVNYAEGAMQDVLSYLREAIEQQND